MTDRPAYADLPVIEAIGLRTSWDVLPSAVGMLALQSAEVVRDAVLSVQTGEVVSLSLDATEFTPPLFGRPALVNKVTETARNTFEDDIAEFNPQASSQWDGLPHIRAREFGFFGGITDLDEARERLGIHHWSRGVVGRGVLVDLPRVLGQLGEEWDPLSGQTVAPTILRRALEVAGVVLGHGDVLLVRTGWLAASRAQGTPFSGDRFSGLSSTDEMVELLWNAGVSAVGSDNPAIESAPGDPRDGSLHRKLIPGLGFALAELLDLEELAERCAASDRATFLFVAVPTRLRGAVSSPANAIAIL